MKRLVLVVPAVLLLGAHEAWAHVTVAPRESRPGVSERDTVRVPTEGNVPTVEIEIDMPEGEAGTCSPAPVTTLKAGGQDESSAVAQWLGTYDAAFNAKDLDRLAGFYHPDVTIYEGGGINNGWADYRDHHLGSELKAFEDLQFGHREIRVTMLGPGTAYATARYSLKARMKERVVDSEGLATYLLMRQPDGSWRIRHSHTSSRPARRAPM